MVQVDGIRICLPFILLSLYGLIAIFIFVKIKIMKQQFIFALLAILGFSSIRVSGIAQATDDRGYIVKTGDKAPEDFVLVKADGSKTTLKELKGKVVLLQFTASWCSVCRKEMPHLEGEIWKAYKDKGLVFIGVDRDEPIDVVKKFAAEMKITYPLALDPGAAIFGKFADKKAGVTRNVLIDRDGTIVFLTRLYNDTEFNALKAKVAALFQ